LKAGLEDGGFEVVEYETVRTPLPSGFRAQLKGRFKRMTEEELETVGVRCVLRKP